MKTTPTGRIVDEPKMKDLDYAELEKRVLAHLKAGGLGAGDLKAGSRRAVLDSFLTPGSPQEEYAQQVITHQLREMRTRRDDNLYFAGLASNIDARRAVHIKNAKEAQHNLMVLVWMTEMCKLPGMDDALAQAIALSDNDMKLIYA